MGYPRIRSDRTPPEVVAVLLRDITDVITSPEFARATESEGAFVVGRSPSDFTQRIRSDLAIVEKLMRTTNLKVDE